MAKQPVDRSIRCPALRSDCYCVASHGGVWFVVKTATKRQAKQEGVREFGRGRVSEVRPATVTEYKYYVDVKGASALEPRCAR